jgi:hypothetical protein
MTLEEIVEETRHLPADVVAELVERICSSGMGELMPRLKPPGKAR